jgi:CelD/BcsL family acetyltransferase involved in cellulose biosynthesis
LPPLLPKELEYRNDDRVSVPHSKKACQVHVTVVRPGDLGPAEAVLWRKFQHASPVTLSPFLSLTFAQAVGRSRPNARVAVIEVDGQIEAFFPFDLNARKMAQPIGHPMNDLQGFIWSGAPLDARAVVRQAGLRGWRFISAPAEHAILKPYHYAGTIIQCPVIDLSEGYDSYISSRNKSSMKKIAEKRRCLGRRIGTVSFDWDNSSPERLRDLIGWKSANYSSARALLGQEPAAAVILEELAAADNEDCRGVLSVLFAGERAVAAHLGLQGPHGLAGWLPSYDRDLSRFSPGMIMILGLVEEAAGRGVSRIDMGSGQFDYKFRLATGSYPVAGGAIWASRAEEAARSLYRRFVMKEGRDDGEGGGM